MNLLMPYLVITSSTLMISATTASKSRDVAVALKTSPLYVILSMHFHVLP